MLSKIAIGKQQDEKRRKQAGWRGWMSHNKIKFFLKNICSSKTFLTKLNSHIDLSPQIELL